MRVMEPRRGVNIVATSNSYGALGAVSQTMIDAVNAQRDILFVAAAGNFGLDNDTNEFFPANFDLPNVVSVAATDHNDNLASFSCYGAVSVDLAAPGVDILSCQPGGNYQTLINEALREHFRRVPLRFEAFLLNKFAAH